MQQHRQRQSLYVNSQQHLNTSTNNCCFDSSSSVASLSPMYNNNEQASLSHSNSVIFNTLVENSSFERCDDEYTDEDDKQFEQRLNMSYTNQPLNFYDFVDRKPYHNLNKITIVTVTRLANRKGADLLCAIIPIVCKKYSNVEFIIAGDGPKRTELEQMREKHRLDERVKMLGLVQHKDVRNVLVKGQIFLNCSLTEAFCIAIIEAASCGLYVVSTRVGGVPEVLPSDMASLAEPTPEAMSEALGEAITKHVFNVNPVLYHERIKKMYNWERVAERTETVYDRVMATKPRTLMERFDNFNSAGVIYGKIVCIFLALNFLIYLLCEWLYPRHEIDQAQDITPAAKYINKYKQ